MKNTQLFKCSDHSNIADGTINNDSATSSKNFIYLQNNSKGENYQFILKTLRLEVPTHSITLEKADIDQDGDMDLLMGAFHASPVPVPSAIRNTWDKEGTEVLILENQLTRQ